MIPVTLIPGDGTGPELVAAMRRVVDATGVDIQWEEAPAGESAMKEHGSPLPDVTLDAIKKNRVVFKGPITTPVGSGFRSVNVAIRMHFELYANVRPIASFPGVESCHADLDMVVMRENTEGLYAGIEHMVTPDAAESIRIITRAATERVARYAFDYARKFKRRKVTVVHKANILKATDGLFLKVCREVAGQYPDVEADDRIVDNMAMQLVQKPQLYDVLLCPNLYGDIISDLCAGLTGGLGLAASANVGETCAMFEAVHGSAPRYAGQNKVNPTAVTLAAALMLDHLGSSGPADRIRHAVRSVIQKGATLTYDLGGSAGTSEMADAFIAEMNS